MVPAARRPEYVVVYYIEPYAGNEPALGLDVASIADRREALQQARDTGEPSATGRIILVQESGEQFGLLIFQPVYGNGLPRTTVEERRQHLRGYVTGVFQIRSMVEASLSGLEREGMTLQLYDETAPPGQRVLYSSHGGMPGEGRQEPPSAHAVAGEADPALDGIPGKSPAGLRWSTTLELAGRRWRLQFTPTLTYLGRHQTWQLWTILTGGFLFTSLLGAFLLVVTGRTAHIEQLVAERTSDLAHTNAALGREIAERQQTQELLAMRLRQLEATRNVATEILQELDLTTLLNLITQQAVALIQAANAGAIYLWDEATHVLSPQAWTNVGEWLRAVRIQLGEGLVGTVAQRQEGLRVNDYARSPYVLPEFVEWTGHRAAMAEPLLYRGRLAGVIAVVSGQPEQHYFTQQDQELLALFAAEAALAIANAQLFDLVRTQEAMFHGIFEASPDALVVVDRAGRIVRLNSQAEQMFGSAREELIGQPVEVLMPERCAVLHEQLRAGYFVAPRLRPMGAGAGLFGRRKDRSEFPVDITLSPLATAEGLLALGVIRDMTEQKQAEQELASTNAELRRSNQELEQCAYVASHDLQEPLRAVAGCVQILQRRYQGQFDSRGDELIWHTVDGVTRMQALIHDLLAFSRVATRGQPFVLTDCAAVLQDVLANLAASIREAGAVVTHDPLPTVMADPIQMLQLFQNLISNSIKFHAERPPAIHISAVRQDGAWVFAVRDNGIGIAREYWERIFVIFQRLHTRTEYAGTGIGLALCKKIVERHGGRIWVESEPGTGSTFCFTLPDRKGSG
jgi:PAS domain S-box-containing protein